MSVVSERLDLPAADGSELMYDVIEETSSGSLEATSSGSLEATNSSGSPTTSKPSSPCPTQPNPSSPTEDGHGHATSRIDSYYADVFVPGFIIDDRYEILSTLGSGSFATVFQCMDLKTDRCELVSAANLPIMPAIHV